ncbi:flagellin lysine-N-methylase [Paenibacillus sp. GCM10027626]|uniref:flagellin lysine-N-methylase n=1 Tax=Paenibacillus sp. GCM10027626 TaxID=3273411 RepID=UPI0036396E4B
MDNKTLMPAYMREFKCIGAECEDTCCALWSIWVDQETFMKYKRVEHPTLSAQLKSDVKVNKANERTKSNYAVMKLNQKTGACCFYADGLCSIQKELGEAYLSQTCATYPRTVNEIAGKQEVSAVLSCPEAARIALLNPEGIDFVYEEPLTATNLQWSARVNPKQTEASPQYKQFWELRVLAIEIIQNRRFSLPHRFMQLAVFADRVDDSLKINKDYPLTQLIDQFRIELSSEQGIAATAIFPVNHQFQLRFLNDLLQTVMIQNLWHNIRYKECLDEYIEGMQAGGNGSLDELIEYYDRIYAEYYQPFDVEHEYIMENYLVNQIYNSMFPLSANSNMFGSVLQLGISYALIRTHLIGMSAVHRGLTPDLAIKLVQSFTRNFEHAKKFKQIVKDKCKNENIELGHLSLLIMH